MSVTAGRVPRAPVEVRGRVAPGFEPVREAFAANLRERGELGAAFAVQRGDELLVDLWGGLADGKTGRAWEHDTLVTVFSQTKAWAALCLLRLVERGRLGLAAPVAEHWPAFAAAGKEAITVADVLSHTSRLPALAAPASVRDLARPQQMEARLARQAPEADPRARLLYHGLTYGWLCDALVRHVDGRSCGAFLREEICEPLGLELWIGLPAALDGRVATLEYGADWGANDGADPAKLATDDLLRRYWANPVLYPPGAVLWNEPWLRRAEVPAINGVGQARSIARLYALLVGGDGAVLAPEIVALATRPLSRGSDPFSGRPVAFGAGFQLQTDLRPFGPVEAAFGHSGMGGSIHGAWPQDGVGFSYCLNRLRDAEGVDRRAMALTTALATSLGR